MTDTLHTNEQRITKIRGVLEAINRLTTSPRITTDPELRYLMDDLATLANESSESLDGLEKFLADRKALGGVE